VHRGLNVHSLAPEHWPDMERDLDAVQETGADVVRIDVSWYTLEAVGKGSYETSTSWYLERLDAFMDAADARGLDVVPTLWQTPCWAADASEATREACLYTGSLVNTPPKDPETYGDIAAFLADRYRDKLAAIEVWNEPNHTGFFVAVDQAAEYAELVKAAYPKIKAAAPDVKVLAGALSTADAGFLRQLYAHGIRGSYDAISVHPYMVDSTAPPDVPYPQFIAQFSFWDGLKLIRSTQEAANDAAPVWATEYGWNTSSAREPMSWLNGVSEETQAEYLKRALRLLSDPGSDLGFVEGALIYSLRDSGSDIDDVNQNFGILRHDFSRKPSFSVVQADYTAR
jgi:hypothetical protein